MTEFERTILNQITNRIKKIEDKQEEQDKKIEQLEKKVKLASIGFPVNLFK